PDAGGFSFPSGHTQNSVGIFGTLATITKKWWVRAICLSLCVIVPFSRMYLGVHTPLDVGFSFFFAIIVIYITRMIFELAYSSTRGMFIFLSSMGVIAVLFLVYVEFIFDPTTLAESQMHNYVSAQKNAYMILGALIGVIISFPIERFLIKFDEKGKWYTQILKVTIGLLLVLGLLNGLKLPLNAILPENTIARAVRYGIVVVFVIAVYPISFKWFRRLEDAIEKRRIAKKYSKDK
ncbi:MAG: phosphatase PAP2 family protein, partial [Clostridia bacterium]|nr:phosphatase PAP2 family protein [Clostridia bacterium]